jgi:hypothetical protein
VKSSIPAIAFSPVRATMPAPIIAYIRVSTDKQDKSGLGLEAQQDAIARFAACESLETAGEFIEVETGKGADALDKAPTARRSAVQSQADQGTHCCLETRPAKLFTSFPA